MAIDYSSALGQVRLLIADVDEAALILDDAMVAGYLGMHGLNGATTDADQCAVKLAAADALDAIASSEALVSKKIRSQDISTDGPAVAAALRAHAVQLREQADADASSIEVIEFAPYPVGEAW